MAKSFSVIRIEGAMYCIGCDTIYDFREVRSATCPTCTNRGCVSLSRWLNRSKEAARVPVWETSGDATGPALSVPKPPASKYGYGR